MLLVIDSGNTNIVFGLCDMESNQVIKAFRTNNDPKRTADEYIVWLTALMRLNKVDHHPIEGTILASVVPEASFNLISLCRRYFNHEPLMIGNPNVKLGIKINIDRPEQVGADRLVNAVAAHHHYGGSVIIIDFGTATTFDIVDQHGNYSGGVIAPGPNLSLRSLYQAAAKLPLVEIARPQTVIGKTTEQAMQSGVFWGYIAMIEGMIKRIEQEYGTAMTVVATGGLSDLFSNNTDCIHHTDRSLTLRGLAQIYALNHNS